MAADSLYEAGLTLPPLSPDVKAELEDIASPAGNIYKNPINNSRFFLRSEFFQRAVKALSNWDGIDLACIHLAYDVMGYDMNREVETGFTREIARMVAEHTRDLELPLFIVLHHTTTPKTYHAMIEDQGICHGAGLPVFLSMEKAAKALSKYFAHRQRRDEFRNL
jgi:acyl-CoA synthetase (NDP forming)